MPRSYKFTFGPWNISQGADPFGPVVRDEVAFPIGPCLRRGESQRDAGVAV